MLAVVLAALPVVTGNLETKDLNDNVRRELGRKFMKLSDGMVHYDVSGPGKGELVVLVHGNAAPYFSWDKNLQALTGAGFRVVRYDLYGFGYSDRPDVIYSRELYDRQLSEVLAKLNIKGPVNLVGTSQGGSIAVYFAAKHPERVKRLALLSPFINVLPMKAMIGLIKVPGIGDISGASRSTASTSTIRRRCSRTYPPSRTNTRRNTANSSPTGDSSAPGSPIFAAIRLRTLPPQYETVGKSGIPALLTWGTADIVIMADSIANIRKAVPGLEYHEIEGGGHLVHYESPEKVNPVLVRFLKE